MKSDRDRLEDELNTINLFLSSEDTWTVEFSKNFIRKEEIKKLLKELGKKDWFK